MAQAESALVSDAKLTLQFFGRYTVAGSGHQVHGMEPESQFCAGLFKYGSGAWVNMATLLAGESPTAFDLRHFGNDTTGRAAINLAVFPVEDREQASIIGGVLGAKLCVCKFFRCHFIFSTP